MATKSYNRCKPRHITVTPGSPLPWRPKNPPNWAIQWAACLRVRALIVEMAWCWLKYQPQSDLRRWFQKRFGGGGKRQRRVGLVALARRLLIALWQYLAEGVIPAGAYLKTA